MIQKEALDHAYAAGVQQALIDAGLVKEAGPSGFNKILGGAGRAMQDLARNPNVAPKFQSPGAETWLTSLLQRGKSLPEGTEALLGSQLSPVGHRAVQAGIAGKVPAQAGMKAALRTVNRLAPTSAAAMPKRPAFGGMGATNLPPSRLPG